LWFKASHLSSVLIFVFGEIVFESKMAENTEKGEKEKEKKDHSRSRSNSLKGMFRSKKKDNLWGGDNLFGSENESVISSNEINDLQLDEKVYKFMQEDYIGSVLLALARDNFELSKRLNFKESNINIEQMCNAHYAHSLEEKENASETQKNAVKQIEKNLIERDLNSHRINLSFEPPSNFSPVQTLYSTSDRADAEKLFPCRTKFSGGHGNNSIGLVEYFSMLSTAQEATRLSRSEFLDMLKKTTTGKAHSLLLEWLSTDSDLDSVYHQFTLYFDTRVSSVDAKKILVSYKAPKTSSLHEMQAYIMELCQRAVEEVPKGISRTTMYNLECIQSLIRALPAASSLLVANTYNSISTRLERPCTASELSRALNTFRGSIDTDIRQNGTGGAKQESAGAGNGKQKWFGKFSGKKSPQTSGYTPNPAVNGLSSGQHASASVSALQSGSNSNPQGTSGRGRGRSSNRGNSRGGSNGNNTRGQGVPRKFCSLCGLTSHNAADGCRIMRNDRNELVNLLPVQDTCKLCPQTVTTRLHHPPTVCPYRPGGIWVNRK
jgi:hypothetical protein